MSIRRISEWVLGIPMPCARHTAFNAFSAACCALKHKSSKKIPFKPPPFSAKFKFPLARNNHARGSVGSLGFIKYASLLKGGLKNCPCAPTVLFQIFFGCHHNI